MIESNKRDFETSLSDLEGLLTDDSLSKEVTDIIETLVQEYNGHYVYDINELISESEDSGERINELEQENDNLNAENSSHEEEIDILNAENDNLSEKISQLVEEV